MSSPIACRLKDAEEKRKRMKLEEELLAAVRETVELEDGYALRFPGEPAWLRRLAEFAVLERACCPFLAIELAAEPEGGPIWLRLRGPAGTRDFLAGNFALCRRADA